MKSVPLVLFITLSLAACGITKPHEKTAQENARQQGLSVVAKPRFDATFIASTMHFDQYKKIKIDNLDLSNVKIIEPTTRSSYNEPWQLSDEDKRYYQAKYADAAKKSLIESGLYSP